MSALTVPTLDETCESAAAISESLGFGGGGGTAEDMAGVPTIRDPTTPNPMTSCARRIDLREGPRRDSPPRVTCLTNNSPSRVTPRPAGSPIRAGRECADQALVAHSPRAARRPGRAVRTPPSTPREQGNRQVRVEQHQPVCDTSSPKSASCTVRHSSVLWKL